MLKQLTFNSFTFFRSCCCLLTLGFSGSDGHNPSNRHVDLEAVKQRGYNFRKWSSRFSSLILSPSRCTSTRATVGGVALRQSNATNTALASALSLD